LIYEFHKSFYGYAIFISDVPEQET